MQDIRFLYLVHVPVRGDPGISSKVSDLPKRKKSFFLLMVIRDVMIQVVVVYPIFFRNRQARAGHSRNA